MGGSVTLRYLEAYIKANHLHSILLAEVIFVARALFCPIGLKKHAGMVQ
jgi:hypothetical protein